MDDPCKEAHSWGSRSDRTLRSTWVSVPGVGRFIFKDEVSRTRNSRVGGDHLGKLRTGSRKSTLLPSTQTKETEGEGRRR